jgi:hypothetical protein
MKKIIFFISKIFLLIVILQTIFLIGLPYKKMIKYNNGLTIVEWKKLNIYLLTPFGDNGHFILQPFPTMTKTIVSQKIIFKGTVLFKQENGYFTMKTDYFEYHISPDKNFVLRTHFLHVEPFVIFKLLEDKKFIIEAPEIEGHYYGYPFSFVGWSDDSKYINIVVNGSKYNKNKGFVDYKQNWRIDVKNELLEFIDEVTD